jgi:acyl-CoA reductase-like NAD-dependent aldehyde dehydrogenase
MNTTPHIPVFRFGKTYESLDGTALVDFRQDGELAQVSQANPGLIRRDLQRLKAAATLTVAERCDICAEAGELFLTGELWGQRPEDYVQALSASGGLPHSLCRANMQKIHRALTEMPMVLKGLTRGLDLAAVDEGVAEQDGLLLSYYPAANALGVVLPSNSPGVNSLWLPAIALGIPVVLKPGREDPWTPWRILQALLAAGCPPELLAFYPTSHEGADAVLQGCDRAILFGDASTVERYAGDPSVSVHGPGYSKVLVGEDRIEDWPSFLDVLVDSVAANSGRSCVNASTLVVPRHADAVAGGLAERLAAIPLEKLAGFANPVVAEWTNQRIEEALAGPGAVDRSGHASRIVVRDGVTYLLPTVVQCADRSHPLAQTEFLFPFVSVVEMPQSEMLGWIGPTLVGSVVTRDPDFSARAIRCPHIDRLNLGDISTPTVRWDQPHEGNLFEFLYRRRAIQREGHAAASD